MTIQQDIYSDISPNILSDIYSDILFGILSDMYSDILFGIVSDMHSAMYLAVYLTFYLAFSLTVSSVGEVDKKRTREKPRVAKKSILLRVIPTATSQFVIAPDVPSGRIGGIYFLTLYFFRHSFWHCI